MESSAQEEKRHQKRECGQRERKHPTQAAERRPRETGAWAVGSGRLGALASGPSRQGPRCRASTVMGKNLPELEKHPDLQSQGDQRAAHRKAPEEPVPGQSATERRAVSTGRLLTGPRVASPRSRASLLVPQGPPGRGCRAVRTEEASETKYRPLFSTSLWDSFFRGGSRRRRLLGTHVGCRSCPHHTCTLCPSFPHTIDE